MYNPASLNANEFISDEEVMESLAYADANKDNYPLIRQILDKAALRKGLSHREASVLLACDDPELIGEMYDLAEQIKKDFYGNRIVIFAPLYLSNYCVNGCLYCPYHQKNKHIPRKKLTQEEVETRSGFSQQYLSSLERGRRNPTVITLYELARALGVSHMELVKPDDEA